MKKKDLALFIKRFQEETGTKFNLTAHKELWEWVAHNPGKGKSEWPGWSTNGGHYNLNFRECFACEYAESLQTFLFENNLIGRPVTTACCAYCPFDTHNLIADQCLDGTFMAWARNGSQSAGREERSLYIANFPVREGVECE